jgi:hypothetical protein
MGLMTLNQKETMIVMFNCFKSETNVTEMHPLYRPITVKTAKTLTFLAGQHGVALA